MPRACGSFMFLISGFSKLISVIALFEDVQITSELLKEIASVDPEKGFPDLTDLLKFYQVFAPSNLLDTRESNKDRLLS